MLGSVLKSKNVKNSIWIIGEQIFQMILSLVIGMLSARYLGPSNYGALNYTASFVSFFINIAALGMNGVVIKKIVEHPKEEGIYVGSAIVYRIFASFFSTVSIAVLILVLNPGDELKLFLALLQSIQLFFKSINILDVWFQRYLKSKFVSIGKLLASIVVSVYRLCLLISGKGILWFAISTALSDFVIAGVLLLFYYLQKGAKLKFDVKYGNSILKESYHFVLSDMMAALYTYLDRIMIGQMMTDKDVGIYTTAVTVCSLWTFVPTAIINSFRPTIMEIKEKGNDKLYRLRLEQLISAVVWLCIVVAVIISTLAEVVIYILYGPDYIQSVEPLKILIWAEVFSVVSTTRTIWILCEKKNKYIKKYVAVGTVVNCLLNFFMISRMGITGAAWATLVTAFTVCILAPVFFKQTRDITKIILRSIACIWFFEERKKKITN